MNISKLRLDNDDLSDGNLSDTVAVEEYPHNSNRKTEKILEKIRLEEPVPGEISNVSEDVNAFLNISADEVLDDSADKEEQDQAKPSDQAVTVTPPST